MKSVDAGACRINAAHIGEVTIDALGQEIRLTGTAVLLDGRTGDRLGHHKRTSWSPATHQALVALLESMEQDVLVSLFGDEVAAQDGPSTAEPSSMDGVPGL